MQGVAALLGGITSWTLGLGYQTGVSEECVMCERRVTSCDV
jgi:hypothetical protein